MGSLSKRLRCFKIFCEEISCKVSQLQAVLFKIPCGGENRL